MCVCVCVCVCIGQSHRCTASWKVEEGIRTMSLRHLVQHRQELDSMSWLEERRVEERRGKERGGKEEQKSRKEGVRQESDGHYYVTDADH